jgi:DNA-directed RNA polymerase specialized sigma24 family protein
MHTHPLSRTTLDEAKAELLVRRTLEGDRRTRDELWLLLDPVLETIVGRWRVTSRLAEREDERRNIVLLVMERLHAGDLRRLRLFHAALVPLDGSGQHWISAVTRRVAYNYTRRHAERLGTGRAGDPRRWADLGPITEEVDGLLSVSPRAAAAADAQRIRAYAKERLTPLQHAALYLWLEGYDDSEIAAALHLEGCGAAARLLRAGIKRLRYRFAREGAGESGKNIRHGVLPKSPETVSWRG